MVTLLGRNPAVQSLTLKLHGSPGAYENTWVPELLYSVRQRPLRDITFEMCLDHERALREPLWQNTTGIVQFHWFETLKTVAFVHEPVQDELMYHNRASFLLDGAPAFKKYFEKQLTRQGLVVRVGNAPILDLSAYMSNI